MRRISARMTSIPLCLLALAGCNPTNVDLNENRAQSAEKLKKIGLAIHDYAEASESRLELCVSGTNAKGKPIKLVGEKPLLSWRVAMLPFLGEVELYKQFKLDEPWDSEHNKKLIAKMPKIYASVSAKAPLGHTFYQMVIGPHAMSPADADPREGIESRPNYCIASLPRGTSNIIAVVEAAEPVIWTKPDDVSIPGKKCPLT
jgi:hypothetical protein